jgi:hypothetical protein
VRQKAQLRAEVAAYDRRQPKEGRDKVREHYAKTLFAMEDDDFDDTVGRPRDSALRAPKKKTKKRTGLFCQRLASAKHRPAWVLMNRRRGPYRGPREFRGRKASYKPKPHPLRSVTREVGGRLVTEEAEAKTPMNRPGLREIFPVLTEERRQTWEMLADMEASLVAWDDSVDFFGDEADQPASDEHGQETGPRREEGAAASSDSEASSTKASGSQGKKRSREDEGDADDDAEIKQDMEKRRKRAKAPSPEDPTHPLTLPPSPPPTSPLQPAMPGALLEEPRVPQPRALKRVRDEEDTQDFTRDGPPHPPNPRPAKRARRRTA